MSHRINPDAGGDPRGRAFAETVFYDGHPVRPLDGRLASFPSRRMGSVGLAEADARKQHGKVDILPAKAPAPMKMTLRCSTKRPLRCRSWWWTGRKPQKVDRLPRCRPRRPPNHQMPAIAMKMASPKAPSGNFPPAAVHPTLAEELVTMRERSTCRWAMGPGWCVDKPPRANRGTGPFAGGAAGCWGRRGFLAPVSPPGWDRWVSCACW